jgi:hypothetical protein
LKLDQFRNVDERLAEMDTGGLGVSFAVLTPAREVAVVSAHRVASVMHSLRM